MHIISTEGGVALCTSLAMKEAWPSCILLAMEVGPLSMLLALKEVWPFYVTHSEGVASQYVCTSDFKVSRSTKNYFGC